MTPAAPAAWLPQIAAPVPHPATPHQPFIAFLLAVVFWWLPGLAHVYNRQWSKAGVYLLIQIMPLILLYLAAIAPTGAKGATGALSIIAIPIAVFSTFCGAFDALFVARRHQEGRFVGTWTFF